MKEEILKKHLKLTKEPKEYYFYAKDKIEIISKKEIEKKMEIFSKKNRLQLLEESKKPNQTKPTYSQVEGTLSPTPKPQAPKRSLHLTQPITL